MHAWILALAALCSPPHEGEELIRPRVEVRGPDGEWVELGDPWHVDALVIPMTSLSEVVPRGGTVRAETALPPLLRWGSPPSPDLGAPLDAVELGMIGGNIRTSFEERVSLIGHGSDEQVVLAEGAPQLIGPLMPPRSVVSSSGEDLAHAVRRDGNVLRGGPIEVVPPTDAPPYLTVFGAPDRRRGSGAEGWTIRINGEEHRLPTGPTAALLLEVDRVPIVLELGEAEVDALGFAEVRAPHSVPMYTLSHAQEDVRQGKSTGSEPFDWKPLHPPVRATASILPQWPDEKVTDDRLIVPGGHRRLNRYATSAWEEGETWAAVARAESFTIFVELHFDGYEPKLRTPASTRAAKDHHPRTIVRYETKDLSRFTAVSSPESLREVTLEAGLGTYVHFEGPAEQLDIRPTMGPGAAWGDLDGDGDLDLVLLQGGGREGCDPLADRLFLNDGDGTFTDATASAGLGRGDAGMGALLVDLDGDADLDLYCANYGLDRLFLNDGDGTFTEATKLLPGHDLWSAGVTAADPDGDGYLDLYVTSYLDYDTEKMPPAAELGRYQREDPVEMLPFAFPGQRNVYLKNTLAETGEFGLADVTEELGLRDEQGRGMQSVFWDFDRDGDEDLYVANDVSFNVLFRNEGDGTFKDVSFSTGLDDPRGGMGLAVGDVDRDGDEDVFLTNWQLEANALYENAVVSHRGRKRRRASFHDATVKSGFGPSGIGKTSWGAEWFDLELDGDLDLYVANGYTSPDYESTGICVGQTDQLFVGDGTGKLKEACQLGRRAFSLAFASRGAIGADYDRDGDVDLLVTANNGRATLLRNDAQRQGRWIGVRLRQPGPNVHAIGATVTVGQQRQSLRAGTGYLTGNAPELHFGLGPGEGPGEGPVQITVEWPGGEVTKVTRTPGSWETIERPGSAALGRDR